MPALGGLLRPCGPVLDARAAASLRADLAARGLEIAPATWEALAPVAAAAPYLAGLMRRDPERLRRLLGEDAQASLRTLLGAVEAVPRRGSGEAGTPRGRAADGEAREPRRALRRLKAELHLLTALCDLGGVWGLMEVTGALSSFADAAVRAALEVAAAEAALTADPAGGPGPAPGLFVLALGKHGARELNYSSDIDLVVFYDPAALAAAEATSGEAASPSAAAGLARRLVQGLVEILQARTEDGYVFRTDLRLRPDPSSTPAAVPVEAALDYYESVGQNWERAALIKARPVAGDEAAADEFLAALSPFIWRRSLDYAAIDDIRAIKRQIHVHKVDERLTAPGADLKLGAGGIREIEFYVQTQQLIFGGRNPALRAPETLAALRALAAAGVAPREAEEDLRDAYERLRGLEHRVQMVADEQTHRLPEARAERARVAALSGFAETAAFDGAVSRILRRVNRRYGELFADDEPLSSRRGSLVFTGVEDDPETLRTLERLGFPDPAQVSGQIRAWHHGRIPATRTERGRELFTRLAPRLLEAAAATGAPGPAFHRFSDFFTRLSAGVQAQSLFLAEPRLFRKVVEALAFAPRLAAALARRPAALDALLDARFFEAPERGEIEARVREALAGAADFEAAMDGARRAHREEAFRIGFGVISGALDAERAGAAFADLADACVQGLAGAALAETERAAGRFPGAVSVIALGKAGSREMTAGSDLDLMTLYERGEAGALSATRGWSAETFYTRFTQRLTAALSAPTAEGGLYAVDLQLRPSGTQGPVAVSLPAFEAYYAAEAETWELLALTRARVVWTSDPEAGARAARALEAALRRPRDPARVRADVLEMRELLERERPPAGVWDLKLTPGGLVDVEFAAQALQLLHAPTGGPLRTRTDEALEALQAEALADAPVLQDLRDAGRLQRNLSQALRIALEEGSDPEVEPQGLRRILTRAGGMRSWPALRRRLEAAQAKGRRAFRAVLAAPDGPVAPRAVGTPEAS